MRTDGTGQVALFFRRPQNYDGLCFGIGTQKGLFPVAGRLKIGGFEDRAPLLLEGFKPFENDHWYLDFICK